MQTLRLVYRSLLADRNRTLLSVLAVAAAIVLVIVLEGFKVGLWQQVRSYRENLSVQLVVMPAGASTTVQTRVVLPPSVVKQVSSAPGVRRTYPLVIVPTIFVRGERSTPISIIGYEQAGGPWRLKSGRGVQAAGELVMDYSLARRFGLAVGDSVYLFGKEFRIVGLSADTAFIFGSYVFISLKDAFSLFSAAHVSQGESDEGALNLLLVEVKQAAQVAQVREEIERIAPAVNVLTPTELAANDVGMVQDIMGSVMNLMVSVAYVVGVLVIGLTLYAAVLERLREYGIMKAIGARNTRLYAYVLSQAVAFAVPGFALGTAFGLGVAALFAWLMPQFLVVVMDAQVLLRVGVAALVMAAVASLLPIRQVAGVDPALVFRQ